ncbi:SDR family oxidoreductase [Aliiglaciecola sp. NS0011-25]|uniref:SDR family oxidoreductase n=1 Tax=Aliiglaciecola sp. NS0011-25 TaxID=3127654 RepID=UPI0031026692
MKRVLITGINSDIGRALTKRILDSRTVLVDGTFRKDSVNVELLKKSKCRLFQVDFSHSDEVAEFNQKTNFNTYDAIYFLHGSLNPIGKFSQVSFADWQQNIYLNCTSILLTLHSSIPKLKHGCRIITLAGGGVNGATENYSAYTLSKISLLKMTELLAAEYPDLLFFNLGPGFVDTAIHQQTLNANENAGKAYQETLRRYQQNEFVPMEKVVNALTFFLADAPSSFSGRNFSAATDCMQSERLFDLLTSSDDAFKLRRANNDFSPK